jgi:hypothetical protein
MDNRKKDQDPTGNPSGKIPVLILAGYTGMKLGSRFHPRSMAIIFIMVTTPHSVVTILRSLGFLSGFFFFPHQLAHDSHEISE